MPRRPFAAALLFAGAALLPMSAFAATGYIDGSTEMHAGPDYDYPTVSVIDDGAPVEVYGCLDDASWCDVSFYSDRGWVAGDHLASIYEGQREPIGYVAPLIGLSILAFSFDSYWDSHYHGRPWYGDRGHWDNYSREHHRANWEGHGGWVGRAAANAHGNDHERHDANDHRNWTGGDRGRAQQDTNDHRNDNGHSLTSGNRDRAAQGEVEHHASGNPAGTPPAGNWAGHRGDEAAQQHNAEHHDTAGRNAQAAQNNAPHPAPQPPHPQAQPQAHPGGEHGGGGGPHGGGEHDGDHKDHGDHHD